jgi:hypothetical protein
MAHNGYVPVLNHMNQQRSFHPSTPPRHPMYTYHSNHNQNNNFAHDLTPQYEYEGFTYGQPAMEQESRALSEPFIFQGNTSPQSSSFEEALPQQETPRSQPHGHRRAPAVPISPSTTTPRIKAKRTPTVGLTSAQASTPNRAETDYMQACEECRKKKQKCDGDQPCQACKEQNIDCQYREVPPTKFVFRLLERLHHQLTI